MCVCWVIPKVPCIPGPCCVQGRRPPPLPPPPRYHGHHQPTVQVNLAAAQAEAALAAFKQGLPLPPTVDLPTPIVPGTAGAAMAAAGNAVAGTHNAAAVAAGTLPPAVAALAAGVGALGGGLLPTPCVELTNMITADVVFG